eukprot:439397-Amphidinium_carterae.1
MAWLTPKGCARLDTLFRGHESAWNSTADGTTWRTAVEPTGCYSKLQRVSAQQRAGWNCPNCTYFNFGFRTTCFGCKTGQRPAASRAATANTGGEEESSVLDHETLGAIGAPTCLRKGPMQ